MANCSAISIGLCSGSTMTEVPRRTRLVRCASAERRIGGDGMMPP